MKAQNLDQFKTNVRGAVKAESFRRLHGTVTGFDTIPDLLWDQLYAMAIALGKSELQIATEMVALEAQK